MFVDQPTGLSEADTSYSRDALLPSPVVTVLIAASLYLITYLAARHHNIRLDWGEPVIPFTIFTASILCSLTFSWEGKPYRCAVGRTYARLARVGLLLLPIIAIGFVWGVHYRTYESNAASYISITFAFGAALSEFRTDRRNWVIIGWGLFWGLPVVLLCLDALQTLFSKLMWR